MSLREIVLKRVVEVQLRPSIHRLSSGMDRCTVEAKAYSTCVARKEGNAKHGECEQEFKQLRLCVLK